MTRPGTGGRLSPLRRRMRSARSALRPLRVYLAVVAGVLTTVLSTVYENLPAGLRYTALAVVALMSGVVLLLTDAGVKQPPRNERDAVGDWPTSGRSGLGAGKRSAWRRRRRRRQTAPPSEARFTGRTNELDRLREWHDMQRARRPRTPQRGEPAVRPTIGCVALFLHGQPGVGKSAIARELATRLAPEYPDGVHFVDLGTAGTGRTPGEVLKDLILALGWDAAEVPAEPRGRAIAFRSLTARKRLLFVFDAARTADQVKLIMPTDPATAVIVTSRRDLTADPEMQATRSLLIEVPTEAEALQIFRAMSGTDDRELPDCAAEVVEHCGRLPVAIQSAAERITAEDTNICAVAQYLAAPATRLSRLEQPGRPVRAIHQAEFDRLLAIEQQALMYLACLPSPSFAPWILMPLLEVDSGQAEALTDRLVAAQMLGVARGNGSTRVVRYTMHPLIRLFARQKADDLPAVERRAAMDRVDRDYQALIAQVLTLLRPSAPVSALPATFVREAHLAARIAMECGAWIHAEYHNLLRQIEVAHDTTANLALCWRLGALLGGATPPGLDYEATMNAYDNAIQAASTLDDSRALAETLMAKGRFLAAMGRYHEGESTFDAAIEAGTKGSAERRHDEVMMHLYLGEALVRAGSHDLANELLDECLRLATESGDRGRIYEAEILIAVNGHVECPYWVQDLIQDGTLEPLGRFYARIASADGARRSGEWRAALAHLETAMEMCRTDVARAAFVAIRTAELHLQYARSLAQGSPSDDESTIAVEINLAVQWACRAMWRYRQMRYTGGEHRAKCSLARAFGAAGLLGVAEQLTHSLKTDTESIEGEMHSVSRATVARVYQAGGELLYRFGDSGSARSLLIQAAALFQTLADPMSEGDVRDTVQRPPVVPRQRIRS